MGINDNAAVSLPYVQILNLLLLIPDDMGDAPCFFLPVVAVVTYCEGFKFPLLPHAV